MEASYFTIQFCFKCGKETTFRPDEGSDDLYCEICGSSYDSHHHNFRISGPDSNGLMTAECTECGLVRVG